MLVSVPISIGELLDKITILEIKKERIRNEEKLRNVVTELDLLSRVRDESVPAGEEMASVYAELRSVNEKLWDIEDDIRECERAKDFGPRFIELARAVYITNDRRAELKNVLNRLSGSLLVEEKSYEAY
ncbi:MAG TPA: DUF6165 family protein [Verrucomicrobiae bacterium]|nr:DUF6165 family protein [Verrucomicrobiae bacterium]